MPSKQKKRKTTVITLKVPQNEYLLWVSYCEHKNISFAKLIEKAVDEYLDPSFLFHDEDLIAHLYNIFEKEYSKGKRTSDKKPLRVITARIPNQKLAQWDKFIKENYLTRTSFIRQALGFYFGEKNSFFKKIPSQFTAKEYNMILPIIYKMILKIGMIDFFYLADIFEIFDERILSRMLSALESFGKIARKGRDTYVPANPMETNMGTMFVAENLARISEDLIKDPYEYDNPEHISLLTNLFRYLESVIESLQKEWKKKDVRTARELEKKLKKELSALMDVSFD